jgi:uncharacterized protein (DUF1778 family)
MNTEQEEGIVLVLQCEGFDDIEVELSQKDFDQISAAAVLQNKTIEEFIVDVLEKQIKEIDS